MPPLEWSMVQSILLSLIAPTFGTAFALMIVVIWVTRSEKIRSTTAAIAFLTGLTVGLAVQNFRGELMPFFAFQQVEHSTEAVNESEPLKTTLGWEFETGWRSLYLATVFAGFGEILIESLVRARSRFWSAAIAGCLVAFVSALLVTPSDLISTRPWVCGVLAIVILLNEVSLRSISHFRFGSFIPISLAILWGGSATLTVVLSHSASFADMAILLGSSLAGVGIVMAIARIQPNALFAGPACFVPGLMLADQQNTYSSIPIAAFVLIAIAPAWLGLLCLPKVRNLIETRPIMVAIWFAIPCAIAVGMAMRAEL